MITVNGIPRPWQKGLRLGELAARHRPGARLLLCNGRPASADTLVRDGDTITLIAAGEMPSAMDTRLTLAERHGRDRQAIFDRAAVGIMGLGGLGSAVAVSLAKVGIGHLILADFDVVELSNIHRQHYFIDQIGMKKTTALKKTLVRINPFVAVTVLDLRLTEKNIPRYFKKVDVLVECFDDPAMKASALRAALTRMDVGYVGASGLAGTGPGNTIRCRRLRDRAYLVGDGVSDVQREKTLFAPRVGIAAQHQANQVVRLLLGERDD